MNIQKIFLKFCTLIAISAILSLSSLSNAQAKNLEKNSQQETCKIIWEELWPKSKKGDLEARFHILTLLAPPPDMTPFLFPGNDGDYASQYRDILIWGVYNSDYLLKQSNENNIAKSYKKIIFEYVRAIARSPSSPATSYLNCINKEKDGCDVQAVKDGLIPPFSDFTKNVDKSVMIKKYGTCKQYFSQAKRRN